MVKHKGDNFKSIRAFGISYINLNFTTPWNSSLCNMDFFLNAWNITFFILESTSFSLITEKMVSVFLTEGNEAIRIEKDMSLIPRSPT